MQTKAEDWTVKITSRRDADYSQDLELLSFEYAYRGGAIEKMEDIPFARGTGEVQLLAWLTEVPEPTMEL